MLPTMAFKIDRPQARLILSADGSPKMKEYRGRGAYLFNQSNNPANSLKTRDSLTTTSDKRGRIEENNYLGAGIS